MKRQYGKSAPTPLTVLDTLKSLRTSTHIIVRTNRSTPISTDPSCLFKIPSNGQKGAKTTDQLAYTLCTIVAGMTSLRHVQFSKCSETLFARRDWIYRLERQGNYYWYPSLVLEMT